MKKRILPILVAALMILTVAGAGLTASAAISMRSKIVDPQFDKVTIDWGKIYGTVDWKDGSPAQGAYVIASTHLIELIMALISGNFSKPYHDQTGEDGTYEIQLPPGDYFVIAFMLLDPDHGRGWSAQTSITVGEGEHKQIDFTLIRITPVPVSKPVPNPVSNPVPNATPSVILRARAVTAMRFCSRLRDMFSMQKNR